MPFGIPGVIVGAGVAPVIGLVVWLRRRHRPAALPKSLTDGPPLTGGRQDAAAPRPTTQVELDLDTPAPDPWT